MTESADKARRKNRLQLATIVAIAMISLGGSYALFYAASNGGLWGTTNNGTFVSPPTTLVDLDIRDADGQPMREGGTWWLWVVPQGRCDAPCETAVHQLRQLHALLNKDADRVRRALVYSNGGGEAGVTEQLKAGYPRLQLLTGEIQALKPGIYVVDPIGNLVFHYVMTDAGKPVLEDLKKLLKVSQIG